MMFQVTKCGQHIFKKGFAGLAPGVAHLPAVGNHFHGNSKLPKLIDNIPSLIIIKNKSTEASLHTVNQQAKIDRPTAETFLHKLRLLGGGEIHLEKNATKGVAVITIDNPKSKNALTGYMMCRLHEIVEELDQWEDGKAVILKGHKNTFCSGGDLNAVMKDIGTPLEGNMMCLFMQQTLSRLKELPLISLAAIEGVALGGGAELLTACDFRLMTDDAEIGFVQSKMGISTGWGGGTRLVNIVGRQKALQLLITARIIQSEEAHKCGLVDFSLSKYRDPVDYCIHWLEQRNYFHADAKIIHVLKKVVTNADSLSVEESLDEERNLFTSVWGGELHQNALKRNKHIKHR